MHGFLSYRNYKHARGQNDRRRPSSVNELIYYCVLNFMSQAKRIVKKLSDMKL